MPAPEVSIIIPCFDQVACTRACWAALQQNTPSYLPHEVIFIDNGSTDDTPQFLASLARANVRVLTNPENRGFAVACNQGAAAAGGKFLLFLNNDTEPLPGWLEPLLVTMAMHPEAGIAGSKLLYPDGTVQHAGVVVEERARQAGGRKPDCLRLQHVHRLENADRPWVNEPREFQCLTGACLMIRREVFDRAGGFDERFRNGHEDIDLCFKTRALGFAVRYCPASVLLHRESVSSGRHDADAENTRLLWERWSGKITPDERDVRAAAGRLEWMELRLQLEELRGFLEELRANEKLADEARSKWSSLEALRSAVRKFLGLSPLLHDLKKTRSALVRVSRCLQSLQQIVQALDRAMPHTRAGLSSAVGPPR